MKTIFFFLISTIVSGCWTYNSPQYTHNLARDNFKLVPYFAKPIMKKYRLSYHQREELMQEGYIGLIYACRKYNETLNIALSTYSSYWIKSYMNTYVKNINKIKKPYPLNEDTYIIPSTHHNIELALIMDILEPWEYEFVRRRFFDKMTIKELAHYYNVSVNTVSCYTTRIQNKIRGHLMRQERFFEVTYKS